MKIELLLISYYGLVDFEEMQEEDEELNIVDVIKHCQFDAMLKFC